MHLALPGVRSCVKKACKAAAYARCQYSSICTRRSGFGVGGSEDENNEVVPWNYNRVHRSDGPDPTENLHIEHSIEALIVWDGDGGG